MKFREYIRMGAGLYIGWSVADSINKVLGKHLTKSKIYNTICEKIKMKNEDILHLKKKQTIITGFARSIYED